ncbi:MAG: hypothetical protein H6Q15_2533, partial [Bacteroidetes bacterium]|nr:hypothetical protein [Bacteroidota bacterium]
ELTNRLYISDVSADKNAIELLNQLLVNYDLEIKKAASDYLYVRPLQKYLLNGRLRDKESKSPLYNFTVYFDGKAFTRTDIDGNFSFSLSKGNHIVAVKEKTYYPQTVNILMNSARSVIIELKKKEKKEKKVVVQAIHKNSNINNPSINKSLSDSLLAKQCPIIDVLPDSSRINLMPMLSLPTYANNYALKTNLILWGLATPNLAIEKKVNKNVTVELLIGVKPGDSEHDGKSVSYLIQPEIRYWFSRSFNGGYLGYHLYYSHFGAENMIFPFQRKGLSNSEWYAGYLYGMGVACGYQWALNKHLHLEATAGVGYVHLAYDKITWNNSWNNNKSLDYNYFGLTKAAINLVYIF